METRPAAAAWISRFARELNTFDPTTTLAEAHWVARQIYDEEMDRLPEKAALALIGRRKRLACLPSRSEWTLRFAMRLLRICMDLEIREARRLGEVVFQKAPEANPEDEATTFAATLSPVDQLPSTIDRRRRRR